MSSQSMSRLRNITIPECIRLMINYLRRNGTGRSSGRVRNPVQAGRSLDPNNQHFRTAYDRCLNHNDDAINQLAGYVHDERNNLRAYSPFAQREYPNTGSNAVPRATPQQLNTLNNLIKNNVSKLNNIIKNIVLISLEKYNSFINLLYISIGNLIIFSIRIKDLIFFLYYLNFLKFTLQYHLIIYNNFYIIELD